MKLRAVIGWATVGVMVSSAAALAVPLPRADATTAEQQRQQQQQQAGAATTATGAAPAAGHVSAGRTLIMDARLGHASLSRTGNGETFLFASVTGADASATASGAKAPPPPLDLAIVVDRSGSMKGERIVNAIAAAVGAVDRMRDGDSVVVVSFDTRADVVVPRTVVDASTRQAIASRIRSIRLGGDTCVSCGIEAARTELAVASVRGTDRVTRMMLLSDGATNAGIRDTPGLRALAARSREMGCPITTIGVDVDFDERVMGALATESNGNHYFVANASGLPAVFNQEFDTLVSSIARDAELVVEPADGVDVEEVFDRSFRREGRRIVVPLGSFSGKEEKSLLVKLRVRGGGADTTADTAPVADVRLVYRDLLDRTDARFSGTLAVAMTTDDAAQRELDPFVRARVERSTTARTLTEANELMNAGRFDEARARLAGRTGDLAKAKVAALAAPKPAPAPDRARSFSKDFDDQSSALAEAEKAADTAASGPATSRSRREAPKKIESVLQSNPFR